MTLARHLRNEADSLRLELTATRRALWAVRVLDAWAKSPRSMRAALLAPWVDGRVSCELQQADVMPSRIYVATTPDAARLAAAEAVFPDLPESERARLGVRP